MAYSIVRDVVSLDVVTALQQMLEGAHAADITGIAFIATIKGRKFMCEVLGSCRRDPHLTRGLLLSLDDDLRAMIRGEPLEVTTT